MLHRRNEKSSESAEASKQALSQAKHDAQGAKEVVSETSKHLEATQQRTLEVRQVTTAMRVIRERNHFAERLEIIMGGHRLT